MIINRLKIYTCKETKEAKQSIDIDSNLYQIETIGSRHSSICCILNCSSPLSESKDYKTLAKVFKKLLMNIENIYVANVYNAKSTSFVHFINEYNFTKILFFGEDSLMNNIPIKLSKLESSKYELASILLVENLNVLTQSKDQNLKKSCWEAIQSFYKS